MVGFFYVQEMVPELIRGNLCGKCQSNRATPMQRGSCQSTYHIAARPASVLISCGKINKKKVNKIRNNKISVIPLIYQNNQSGGQRF
jgi:hypothetical protein